MGKKNKQWCISQTPIQQQGTQPHQIFPQQYSVSQQQSWYTPQTQQLAQPPQLFQCPVSQSPQNQSYLQSQSHQVPQVPSQVPFQPFRVDIQASLNFEPSNSHIAGTYISDPMDIDPPNFTCELIRSFNSLQIHDSNFQDIINDMFNVEPNLVVNMQNVNTSHMLDVTTKFNHKYEQAFINYMNRFNSTNGIYRAIYKKENMQTNAYDCHYLIRFVSNIH